MIYINDQNLWWRMLLGWKEAYVTPEPDYSTQQSWLQLPENPDEHGVDIFWVYPTIFGNDKAWLMDCSSKKLIDAAAATIRDQASVRAY